MGEYVFVFFIVIVAILAMTVYVQRTLQGRIYAVRNFMINEASTAYGNEIDKEYEPYYGKVQSTTERNQVAQERFLPGGATGINRKRIDFQTITNSQSEQAPPKDAQ